jgi:hypothetical protein
MPFEPRVVSPDDQPWHGDAQSDLSPDLEALAERLRADAAMLAERYSAEYSQTGISPAVLEASTASSRDRSPRRSPRWWSVAVVAALSLMVIAAGWTVWRLAFPSVHSGDHATDTVVAVDVGQAASTAERVDDGPGASLPPTAPAIEFGSAETLIMNVNGPELEAVLDLMETQDTEDPLLSI